MTGWRLVGDVGGSNVRFARAAGSSLSERRSYPVRDYASFYDALLRYLDDAGGAEDCNSAAIGVAGPVDRGTVKLTNAPWTIEAAETARLLGGGPTALVNDLQAVALALPHLTDSDLIPIGEARRDAKARRPMLAVNVGTGFGAASALPLSEGWLPCGSEPGHMALGAVDAGEFDLLGAFPTVEDVLSGRGVAALYASIAAKTAPDGQARLTCAEVFQAPAHDAAAARTVEHFTRLLGRISGDLVLASGAWGGAYLCGSVALGWARTQGHAAFRRSFEQKGLMSGRMRQVYSGVITRDDISLIGLTYLQMDGFAGP